jgi:nucleoside-diphosphate-sugar epimerase
MDEVPGVHRRLALTGATGFIGRVLLHHLAARGYRVRALQRPQSRRSLPLCDHYEVVSVEHDDVDACAQALADVDAVVYCAGAVRGTDARAFAPANIDGVRTLCAAAARQPRPPHLVLISSLAATRPALSDYAASKHAGEQCARASGLPAWTILRPPAVYGPGDREMRPLFDAIRHGFAFMVGPRAQRLSLLHVEDLAAAVEACITHRAACAGRSFELDDGRAAGYEWDDIIAATRGRARVLRLRVPRALMQFVAMLNQCCARAIGYAPMLTAGKVRELSEPAWLCNNSALSAATGWTPHISLEVGVARLYSDD